MVENKDIVTPKVILKRKKQLFVKNSTIDAFT